MGALMSSALNARLPPAGTLGRLGSSRPCTPIRKWHSAAYAVRCAARVAARSVASASTNAISDSWIWSMVFAHAARRGSTTSSICSTSRSNLRLAFFQSAGVSSLYSLPPMEASATVTTPPGVFPR